MIVSQKVPETASLIFFRDSSSDSSTESSRDSFLIFSRDSSCVMYQGDTSVLEAYNLYVVQVLLDIMYICIR